LDRLASAVKDLDHLVITTHDAQAALAAAAEQKPDLAILCADSLGPSAFELCKKLKEGRDLAVLLVSTAADQQAQVRAFECGASDILTDMQNQVLITARLRALLTYRQAVRDLRAAYNLVAQRTAQLAKSNAELRGEMAERQKTTAVLRTTEEMARRIQKVEALGQLAGGVAHDFNNILFVILGYCEILEEGLEPAAPLREAVRQIRMAGERASVLTRQLLAFGRRQTMQPKVLDLNEVVEEMSAMLKRIIGEDIELVTVLAPDLGFVKADRVQLEQVILNLVVNARAAMPGGGTLNLETANAVLDEDFVHKHVGSRAGPHVRLAISDTGQGMDAATQAHLFEPFFSTRGPGKGAGMGLAVAYGIVKQSEGSIWVESAPEKGSRFDIYLPLSEDSQGKSSRRMLPAGARGSAAAGEPATILLVEDETPVRELTRRFLEKSGYHVLEAGSCSEAVLLHERNKDKIQLLFTDVVMPKMSGRDLASILTRAHPGLKVLFMSGYAADVLRGSGVTEPGVAFLSKPFSQESLARKVREVLA
jgi:signal transduction histidine kinase